jgi:DNA polymerase-3 subunit beta
MSYRFNIDQNKLTVTGGNMEIYIHNTIDIVGDFTKSILVPKELIFNLVRDLEDPLLEFTITSTSLDKMEVLKLTLTAQDKNYNIPVEAGEDYPGLNIDNTLVFGVKSADVVRGIDKTIFACAGEDVIRKAFSSVCLTLSSGKALYVSCNLNVLSVQQVGATDELEKCELLIPKNTANILKDMPADEDMEISVGKNAVSFKLYDGLEFESVLLDDKFPDYKAITPAKNDKHVEIDRLQLISAIKRVLIFSNAISNSVAMRFSQGAVEVLINNPDSGNAIEKLPATFTGSPITVGFNGKNLLTAVSKIDSDVVFGEFSEPDRAFILHDGSMNAADKENYMLVMPVILHDKLAQVS